MKKKSRTQKIITRVRILAVKGRENLKREGVLPTARKALRVFGLGKINYRKWMKTPLYTEDQLQAQRAHSFDRAVTFSIVTPLYNTPKAFLREMIESVIAQTYAGWELCLADGSDAAHDYVGRVCREYSEEDSRIKYRKLARNLGIAGNSNACIEMAAGDYISLLDHDDVLHPAALHDTMEAICSRGADLVYTDEATFRSPKLDRITVIHFKPDFAPDNLRANNYICHFTSFSRRLLDSCGAFREGFDGAQDHDLMLRLTAEARCIVHIPEVLYYWRASPDSTAETVDNKPYVSQAGVRAVSENLRAAGISAGVEAAAGAPTIYRVRYPLPSPAPKVSIIIANKDHVDDLEVCITSIREKTAYPNYEIIIVENNSTEPETFAYYRKLEAENEDLRVVTWPGEGFNWSSINNYGVREASAGAYLLFLNNDTEVITPDWIGEMLMFAQRPDVGAVGAMLYYPDDLIQHAGVILGIGRVAGHAFYHYSRGARGYMGKLLYAQDLSAVTGACMMMRRSVFDELGGFCEEYPVNYNDIDLCTRVRQAGYLIVWTPFAELYHYESRSRGTLEHPANRRQLEDASRLFVSRWKDVLEKGDPYYNPNCSHRSADYLPGDGREKYRSFPHDER